MKCKLAIINETKKDFHINKNDFLENNNLNFKYVFPVKLSKLY